ncbi:ATP-binding protein [Egicoccus sp. AB-alg2]|uniref:ATP-binding protein n=1 Tax=Egicoccus sp. AB-alg2 TaxID=3242693 RepID=UPI00359D42B6
MGRRSAIWWEPVQALAAVLRNLLLVAYGLLAVAALLQFLRRRQRPAAYLAAAFGVLALTLVLGRVTALLPDTQQAAPQTLTVIGLLAFPWLLAAFAWSFAGALPRWLRWSWVAVGVVAVSFVLVDLAPQRGERDLDDYLFLGAFLAAWLLPSVATAVRLWRAGGSSSRVVRSRMRWLASSLILLTAGLVVAVIGPSREGMPVLAVATSTVSLVAAALALAAFAPPLPLRLWWRRQGTYDFQRMQQQLISAVTPQDAADAVAPILAGHIGAGVVVLSGEHEVLALADLDPSDAEETIRRLREGRPLRPGTEVVALRHGTLVVRMTAYSPFFGDYERELASAYAWQLQLALDRSDLAAKHLEARRRIERSSRELEAMLLGLSHDLRSPAVAIGGYTVLLRAARDDDEREHLLDGISASSDYLNGLVDALLELSRIGRTQTDAEPVDLAEVGRVVRKRIRVTHPEATVDVDDHLPVLCMNPVRAEQLVDNLVTNAVKHGGRPDLQVRVEGHRTSSTFELVVADDGRGIREEDHERIFDLFQRGRDVGARGSGIGLGMVRRIAEQYGGDVRLDGSEVGARFVVTLPASLVEPPAVDRPGDRMADPPRAEA